MKIRFSKSHSSLGPLGTKDPALVESPKNQLLNTTRGPATPAKRHAIPPETQDLQKIQDDSNPTNEPKPPFRRPQGTHGGRRPPNEGPEASGVFVFFFLLPQLRQQRWPFDEGFGQAAEGAGQRRVFFPWLNRSNSGGMDFAIDSFKESGFFQIKHST